MDENLRVTVCVTNWPNILKSQQNKFIQSNWVKIKGQDKPGWITIML